MSTPTRSIPISISRQGPLMSSSLSPASSPLASSPLSSSPSLAIPARINVISSNQNQMAALSSSPIASSPLASSPSSFFFHEAMRASEPDPDSDDDTATINNSNNSDKSVHKVDEKANRSNGQGKGRARADSGDSGYASEASDSDDDLNYFSPLKSKEPILTRLIPLTPFWFSKEDDEHVTKIVQLYEEFLELDRALASSAGRKLPAYKLPTFIGRIIREVTTSPGFVTIDTVELFRHDLRLIGSRMTLLDTKYLLTTWDISDGVPTRWQDLTASPHDFQKWHASRNIACDISYINRLPVWGSRESYQITVESRSRDIGYANEPFNFTKFIPQEWNGAANMNSLNE